MTGPSLIVAPSLLAADFAPDRAAQVAADADWLHVDIMDNTFVPNETIGLPQVRELRAGLVIPFDCHLMIVNPDEMATAYAEVGAHNVTFHAEATPDPVRLAKDVRAAGARAGLAIDRDTPIETYLDILPHLDLLLIMTIKAGFGGQEFLPEMLAKVRTARRHVIAGGLELRIEVDGGIAEDTIVQAAQAGADTFVAGTSVFGAADPVAAIRRLRALASAAAADASDAGSTDEAQG